MEDNIPTLAHVSPSLIEALNGIMGVMLFWMLLFIMLHLARTYIQIKRSYQGRLRPVRVLARIYKDNKPEVALAAIVFSLWCRNFILWYVRFLRDHDLKIENVVTLHAPYMLTTTSAAFVIGVACWVRVISPLEGRDAIIGWILMVGSALILGLGFAYTPMWKVVLWL